VNVFLSDTPYYSNGARPEPIAYKDLLITGLENMGINLVQWERVNSDEKLSRLYSKFIFIKS
jgi:hypothetical protein